MFVWEFFFLVIGGFVWYVFDLFRVLVKVGYYVSVLIMYVEGLLEYECLYGVYVYWVKSL